MGAPILGSVGPNISNKARFLAVLADAAEPICDDCAAAACGFPHRQTVFQLARDLAKTGDIVRAKATCAICGKYENASLISGVTSSPESTGLEPPVLAEARLWFWEGNVQASIVEELQRREYAIESVVDTASKEPGTDIVARSPQGRRLQVTVKGFPEKSRYVQARHWFAGALMDIVLYRGADQEVDLAVGFPDGFPTFRALVARSAWLMQTAPFSVFWVAQSGAVRVQSPIGDQRG